MAAKKGRGLLLQQDKCLSSGRDYVVQQWDSSTFNSELLKIIYPKYAHYNLIFCPKLILKSGIPNLLKLSKGLVFIPCKIWIDGEKLHFYRGADKFLARPGMKQATATEDFDFHISYL
jgi:hypothetical protein